ncbi:MAG: AMIN domain-containing protein [Chromatiales bacterium]
MRTATPCRFVWSALLVLGAMSPAWAEERVTLNEIRHAMLSADRARIELELSAPAGVPPSYAIFNPARIVLDLPGVSLRLAKKTLPVKVGLVHSVTAVEAAGRTRVVINLVRLVPYRVSTADRSIYITVGAPYAMGGAGLGRDAGEDRVEVWSVDFLQGEAEEGRAIITLSNSFAGTTVRQQGRQVVVELPNAHLPERLARRLDVLDFATPIQTIDSFRYDDGTRVVIATTGPFHLLAYQRGNRLTVAITPYRAEKEPLAYIPAFRYRGWPLVH